MSNILYANEIITSKIQKNNVDLSLLEFWKEESFLTHEQHWNKKLLTEKITEQDLITKIKQSDNKSINKLKALQVKYFYSKKIENNKSVSRNYLTAPFLEEFDNQISLLNVKNIDIDYSRNQLHEMLMNNVIRTFIKDVHIFKKFATSKSSKQQYHEYIQKKLYTADDLSKFYNKYTTLLRINDDTTDNYISFISYIINNIQNNFVTIQDYFQLEKCLTKIDINYGDTHESGKSVAILTFGDTELLFKPKNLNITKAFYTLLSYLNNHLDKKLYKLKALFFEDFCIEEKIPYETCRSKNDIKDFYIRFGNLLGIIYMLNGNDIHYENIVAYKEHPVIIDLETLFNIQLDGVFEKNATNKVKFNLAYSILGTGMLPKNSFPNKYGNGFDLSALGNKNQKLPSQKLIIAKDLTSDLFLKEAAPDKNITKNVPKLNDEKVNPYDYYKFILSGFKEALHVFLNLKNEMIRQGGILDIFQNLQVRTVLRNTDFYANILFDALSPDKASDTILREMVIDRLYLSYLPKNIIIEEKKALLNNDVPVFYTNTSSKSIFTEKSTYKNMYKTTPIDLVRQKINCLDENIISKQCDLLNNILLVNCNTTKPKVPTTTLKNIKCNNNIYFQNELISKEIQKLMHFSYKGDDKFNDINWEGMKLTCNNLYDYNALDINYSDGLSGIFLLLLYENSSSLDTKIMNSILQNIKIHDNFFSAYYDILSSLKPLIILASRYNDLNCLKKFHLILDAYISNISKIFILDYFSGLSGILSLLRDIFFYCKNQNAKDHVRKAIILSETRILSLKNDISKDIGFAHGNSGIIYGLLRGYEVTKNSKILQIVSELIEENDYKIIQKQNDFTLSHGLLGILLSRALYKNFQPTYSIKNQIDFLKEHYHFDNYSICNGASGFIEVSNILEDLGFNDLLIEKNRVISHLIKSGDFLSGFPNNIDSWNLLLGKAGFLYTLKRNISKGTINLI